MSVFALIPKDIFDDYFDIIPPETKLHSQVCRFKKDLEWHPMSGGDDTFIQSYSFCHARSCITYGDYSDHPMKIVGIYEFEWI